MAKITIFDLTRKRNITVDKRLGDALVKMKRAQYLDAALPAYNTRMLVADIKESGKGKRGRKPKKKDEVEPLDVSIEDENFVAERETLDNNVTENAVESDVLETSETDKE